MGHLADHVKEFDAKQDDTLHYLLGAVAGTIGYKGSSDAEKIATITAIIEDFNSCFPSEAINKALKGVFP